MGWRGSADRVVWPIVLMLGGAASLAVALFGIEIFPPDLVYDPRTIPLAVAGVALIAVGGLWKTAWRRFSMLLALAVVSQACALRLIEAPRYTVYQHYLPWGELARPGRLGFTIVLTFQLCVCLLLTWRRRAAFERALRRVRWWAAVGFMGFFGFSVAVPTQSFGRFAGETLLALVIAGTFLLNLIHTALAAPDGSLNRVFGWLDQRVSLTPCRGGEKSWDRRLPWVLAVLAAAVACALCVFVFEAVPHIDDSVAYLFQAKTFSTGRLYLPAPPDTASFEVAHVVIDGPKWFSKYFPGWPAVLALGALVGAPWIVNPLLGAVMLLLAHALVRRLSDVATANLVVCLLAVSPWFLFMSASFMAHPATAVWTLLALYGLDKERGNGSGLWAALAGAALGALFLTRPLEAVLIAAVAGPWALGLGAPRLSFRGLFAFAAAAIVFASLMFPYNELLTGRATYAPFTLWSDINWGPGVDVLGFGPDVGIRAWPNMDPLPGHGLADIVLNANKNLYMTNFEMLGWGAGSLLFVVLGVLWPVWHRGDFVLLAVAAFVTLGQHVYWFSGGPDLGARYWYSAIIPLLVMTVRGMQSSAKRFGGAGEMSRHRIFVLAAVASLCAFMTVMPWRSLTKHYRFRDIGQEVALLARQEGFDQALVFVRSEKPSDYQAAFSLNPSTLDRPGTIFARDAGPDHRRAVVDAFSDREVWVIGRPAGAARLRVLQGPLPSGTVPD